MQFLGVKIDEVTRAQALQKVAEFLNGGQHKIFTPNSEMVVKAQKDEYFKKVLNTGDLNICDTMGVQIFTGIKRIPGVDFMMEICRLAAEQNKGVYLLGSGSDDVVKKTAENLQKLFPQLKITGYDKGPTIDEQNPTLYPSPYMGFAAYLHRLLGKENKLFFSLTRLANRGGSETPVFAMVPPPTRGGTEEGVLVNGDDSTIQQINQSNPEILFVAFGMGKQEKWIYENLAKMPNIKIAMGVGGSFDFISGHIKRAPLFMRRLGLEWLYRLIQEPQRFKRIFNATVKFTYLVLKSKFLISNVKSNPND